MNNHDRIGTDRNPDRDRQVEALNPEVVGRLEGLDLNINPENDDEVLGALSAQDKAAALLVAIGEKPAALTLSWGKTYDASDPLVEPHDASVEYVDILHGLGLRTFVDLETMEAMPDPTRPSVARRLAVRTVYMARTEEELNRLIDASAKNDRLAIGRALGYPETSIQAFVNGNNIKFPISLISDADPALGSFNFFALSSDNYEAELTVAARWAKAVRQASPAIYDAATNTAS